MNAVRSLHLILNPIFMHVVITYDIPNDRRRTKLHSLLKSYGQWMQYSVFECNLTQTEYTKLRNRLNKLINAHEDSIRFYFLCECCQQKVGRIGGVEVRDDSIFFV